MDDSCTSGVEAYSIGMLFVTRVGSPKLKKTVENIEWIGAASKLSPSKIVEEAFDSSESRFRTLAYILS